MTPRLLGYPNRFQNSLLYMPELTTSNIHIFLHLLRPGTPYTLMLQQELIVTSYIRSLRLDMLR